MPQGRLNLKKTKHEQLFKKMKNEDEMIDALLHEHARKGNQDDAEFIASLEQRLDEEDGVVAMPRGSRRAKSRVGTGVGIAAALTVAAVGFYGWKQKRASDLTMNSVHQVEASESARGSSAYSEKKASGKQAPVAAPEATVKLESDVNTPARPEEPVRLSIPPLFAKGSKKDDFGSDGAAVPRPAPRSPAPVVSSRSRGSVSASMKKVMGSSRRGFWYDESDARRIPVRTVPDGVGRAVATPGNRYGALVDNAFKSPWKAPLSTFSVDVDTASYTNIRRMIQGGQSVPANAVRIEEMINYFNYAYPQPEGRHPFSVNVETATCPWSPGHRLVKVGLQGKEIIREARPAANLVFLLDVSGSMNAQDKLPLLVDSMKILLGELNADDSVSIVVYAGAQGLALPPTYVNKDGRQTILKSLASMRSGGSTNGGAGITLAYKMAKKHFVKGGVNRVILGTDGDFNVGLTDRKALVSMVEREAGSGVFLSVLGFGQGNLNDAMLEDITNKGNGNYSYIDNLREGRKVFLDDMMGTMVTIAKDVKIQVEFNPAKVKSYRLIGYANRMLKAEDFKNKRIDAGEIGAGHTVTALYEIVPGNAEDAPAVDGLKYQKNKVQPKPATREVVDSAEMMTVKLAYKHPDATKETESTYFNTAVTDGGQGWKDASVDFKFTSGVGLFGMLQRGSSHAGQGDYDLVRELAEAGRGKDPKGLRTEFSDLVRKVAK
jgi:Ca-activated chloride channel family protein